METPESYTMKTPSVEPSSYPADLLEFDRTTHLVRPTLDANKRAQPSTMDLIMSQGWGTQCTKHADGTLGNECKIH